MSDADRTRLAVAAGVTAFAVVYLCAAFLEWPLLTYFPARATWRFTTHAPPETIPYFGLVLWAAVAGIDTGVVTWVGARALGRRPPSRRLDGLLAAWTLTALVLAAAYFTFRAVT